MANHMKADPSRTTLIRRAFEADVRRRSQALKKKIWDAIVVEDVFGLKIGSGSGQIKLNAVVANTRYAFMSDAQKVTSFQSWVKSQVDEGYLQLEGGADPSKPWTSAYMDSSYRKGAASAYIAGKEGMNELQPGTEMSRAKFLERTMASPIAVNKLQILGTRSFEQMKGMTAQISQDLSRILSDGMAHGHSPRKLAKTINDNIDTITKKRGLVIARTEIIHAHAEGQLDTLEQQGVEFVQADVELSTAGDDRVCSICADLEGQIYTIQEARGLIPVHPQCRCAWLPVVDRAGAKGKTSTKKNDGVPSLPTPTKKAPVKSKTRSKPKPKTEPVTVVEPVPGSDIGEAIPAKPRSRKSAAEKALDEARKAGKRLDKARRAVEKAEAKLAKAEANTKLAKANPKAILNPKPKPAMNFMNDGGALDFDALPLEARARISSAEYDATNDFLRFGSRRTNDSEKIDKLFDELGVTLNEDVIAYRGVTGTPYKTKVGDTFEDVGYFRTTADKDRAEMFVTSNKDIQMVEVIVPKNQKILIGDHKNESELYLPRGKRYEVVSSKQRQNGWKLENDDLVPATRWDIQVRVVDDVE